jgi:hypothetical protein
MLNLLLFRTYASAFILKVNLSPISVEFLLLMTLLHGAGINGGRVAGAYTRSHFG